MTEELGVLYIEDNENHQRVMKRSLKKIDSINFSFQAVDDADSVSKVLESEEFDIIFLDYKLPDKSGMEVLDTLRNNEVDIPIIIVTGQGDERLAAKAIRNGAQDYIPKTEITPDELQESIEYSREEYEKKGETWEETHEEIPEEHEMDKSPVALFRGKVLMKGPEKKEERLDNASIKIKKEGLDIEGCEKSPIKLDNIEKISLSQWSPKKSDKAISITKSDENYVFHVKLTSKTESKDFLSQLFKLLIGNPTVFGRHRLKGNQKSGWEIGELEIFKNNIFLSLKSIKVLVDLSSVDQVKTRMVKRERKKAYVLGINHAVSGRKAYTTVGVYEKKSADQLLSYIQINKELRKI